MNAFHWRTQPSATATDAPKRGRPRLYDDEERAQRHREAALQSYHKSGKTTRESRYPPLQFFEQGDKDREAMR